MPDVLFGVLLALLYDYASQSLYNHAVSRDWYHFNVIGSSGHDPVQVLL
jgi:hypothetical protein